MSESTHAAEPALDGATLAEVKEIMEEQFDDLVKTFTRESAARISKVRDGLRERDCIRVEQAAHALKSSAGNLGALRLPALAREMELLAKSGDLPDSMELLDLISQEYERIRGELLA